MHQMKLTNKQIQDIVVDIRRQLKNIKTMSGELAINYKMPEQKDHEKAKLYIKSEAWVKICALVSECSKEIAWHGTVERGDEPNKFTITDIVVFPQTVTGATVTSDETEYSLWLAQQPDNIFNKLRFHGHSHVNMGVSPSGVDTEYQNDMLRNLNDFYIFAIFNKKGDHWCAIYDIQSNVAYSNSDIEIITPNKWAEDQIKEYVKEPAPVTAAAVAKKSTKKDKKKETSNTPYTDSFMNDAPDDGYDYYTSGAWRSGYGGYYG